MRDSIARRILRENMEVLKQAVRNPVQSVHETPIRLALA
jgi:hypothetical protein